MIAAVILDLTHTLKVAVSLPFTYHATLTVTGQTVAPKLLLVRPSSALERPLLSKKFAVSEAYGGVV